MILKRDSKRIKELEKINVQRRKLNGKLRQEIDILESQLDFITYQNIVIENLQKQFPKMPKKKKKRKLTREEIKRRQELRRARAESVGLAIMTIFFFTMMLVSLYLLYCCLFKGLTF